MVTEHRARTSLTKTDLKTSAGLELVAILQDLSSDGQLTRDECDQLHAWLDQHSEVELPATSHLQTVLHEIVKDGVVTDAELDLLHDAILRVMPIEFRSIATLRRRERKAAAKQEVRQRKDEERDRQRQERERNRPLARMDIMIAGASKSRERKDACECCSEGDPVVLERQPENRYDRNAILIRNAGGDELGFVPRDEASYFAPLLDGGAKSVCSVKKLLQWSNGAVVPVIVGTFYGADAMVPEVGTIPECALVGVTGSAPAGTASVVPTSSVTAAPPSVSVPPVTVAGPFPVPKRDSWQRGILWTFLIGLGLLYLLAALMWLFS